MAMKAVILGSTGLVGNLLLNLLISDDEFSEVIAFSRRPLGLRVDKLKNVVGDLSSLAKYADELRGDVYFCCLGTTIKKAGSQEAFRAVDQHAVIEFAKIAKANGARAFAVITASGSDPSSPIFYSRVKGETEEALQKLGLSSLRILRPSLLLGPRRELRLGERVFQWTEHLPIWKGPLLRFKPIQATVVAKAMRESLNKKTDQPVWILENEELLGYADIGSRVSH